MSAYGPSGHTCAFLLSTETTLCSIQHPPPPPPNPTRHPHHPPPLGTKEDFNTCCSSSQWAAPQRLSDPSHHLTGWEEAQLTGNPSLRRRRLDQVQKWDTGRNRVLRGLSLRNCSPNRTLLHFWLLQSEISTMEEDMDEGQTQKGKNAFLCTFG